MSDKIKNIVTLMEMTDPNSEAGYHLDRMVESCSTDEQLLIALELTRRLEEVND